MLQRMLHYSAAGVDGYYGYETAAAVLRFQVDKHLPQTSRFGPAEWTAMFPAPVNPFGALNDNRSVLGDLLVTGWGIDADTTGPIQVSATLDGIQVATESASQNRGDVARTFPAYGPDHGFEFLIPASDVPHQVCVTLHNAAGTPGVDVTLPCQTVSFQHNPVGALESVAQHLAGVSVTGYALDPDTATQPAPELTVDGAAISPTFTTVSRPDLAARYPGLGDALGFSTVLTLAEGTHTVCLTAPNALGTPGSDLSAGCRTVTVKHTPVGAVTQAQAVTGGVQLSGWALDPDTSAPVDLTVSSDGTPVTTLTASSAVPGLAATWPDQGGDHGFSALLSLPSGTHTVCVTIANAPTTPGADLTLPCRTLTVP
jgi:hypothetical protein